jgi:hypothetical protein
MNRSLRIINKGFKAEITNRDNEYKFMDQVRWCYEHKSKIRFLWFFERDAKFECMSLVNTNTFYFEKESDRNWFLIRWSCMIHLKVFTFSAMDDNLSKEWDRLDSWIPWIQYIKSLPHVIEAEWNTTYTRITFKNEAHKNWFVLSWS